MSHKNVIAATRESQDDPEQRVAIRLKSPSDFRSIGEFVDKLDALAGLPGPEQWREILALSQKQRMPSIWKRVGYSPLENEALYLLTTMAFSNAKTWPKIVRGILKRLGLEVDRRGRPWKHPQEVTDIVRGQGLEKLICLFSKGFKVKRQTLPAQGAKNIVARLRKLNLDDQQIDLILEMNTPFDAACRYYRETRDPTVTVKAIKNSFARYEQAKAKTYHA